MSDPPPATPSTSAQAPRPRLRTVDRQQLLPAMPLEDLLETDHQARVVWDFVAQLDLAPLYARIRAVEGGPGRPAIDPRILTAVSVIPGRSDATRPCPPILTVTA